MPRYSYRCPECMSVFERDRPIAERDHVWCPRCMFWDITVLCERLVGAPSFVVKGFRAATGYSRKD